MENNDSLDKLPKKTIVFNVAECISFLQKSNDVKVVTLKQNEIKQNFFLRCITHNSDLMNIVVRYKFENREEILDFFQKIIQYNISIVFIDINLNGELCGFGDTHIDQDKMNSEEQKEEEIKKQLNINRLFVKLHMQLYKREVSYHQDEKVKHNKKPKMTDNSSIFKDVIFFQKKKLEEEERRLSSSSTSTSSNEKSMEDIERRKKNIQDVEDKITKRINFFESQKTKLLPVTIFSIQKQIDEIQKLQKSMKERNPNSDENVSPQPLQTSQESQNHIHQNLDNLRKLSARLIFNKMNDNTPSQQYQSYSNYFNIKEYFYDMEGHLIFAPANTLRDYLFFPRIESHVILSCSYYKNIKNTNKNILFIGERHLTPDDDTIIYSFLKNLIYLNYENKSCLNIFVESSYFPQEPFLEPEEFHTIDKQKANDEYRSEPHLGGFLSFLRRHSNYFHFKGTQFHSTDLRQYPKGIKNRTLFLLQTVKITEHSKLVSFFFRDDCDQKFISHIYNIILNQLQKLDELETFEEGSSIFKEELPVNISFVEFLIDKSKTLHGDNFLQHIYDESEKYIQSKQSSSNPDLKELLENIVQEQKEDLKYTKAVEKLDENFCTFEDIHDYMIKIYNRPASMIMDIYTICRMFRRFDEDNQKKRFPSCDNLENHLKNIVYYAGNTHIRNIEGFIETCILKDDVKKAKIFSHHFVPLNFPYFDYPKNKLLEWYPKIAKYEKSKQQKIRGFGYTFSSRKRANIIYQFLKSLKYENINVDEINHLLNSVKCPSYADTILSFLRTAEIYIIILPKNTDVVYSDSRNFHYVDKGTQYDSYVQELLNYYNKDGYFPENIENIINDFEEWCESAILGTID